MASGRTPLTALVTVMNTKHLATGSVCPPMEPGALRCISMRYCPFAQRTLLVLAAKKIKHEIVNVNLKNKPEWLFEKNPLGKVPILEQNGKIMYESLITCDYLDEAYPDPPLYPSDPWKKAYERVMMELFSKVTTPFFKVLHAKGDMEVISKSYEDLRAGLEVFEKELAQRGTKYYGGDKPGMLDYMIWPWIERLPLLKLVLGDSAAINEDHFPKLLSWAASMKEDPAVKSVYLTPEQHEQFIMSRLNETFQYDFE